MMRIIEEKREKRENVITAAMDKCCRTEYPSGLLILYAIGTDDSLPTERILIDKWTDIHSGDTRDVFTKKLLRSAYPTVEKFCEEYNNTSAWMIKFQDGMTVSGGTEAIVRIRTEKERKEVIKILMKIEDGTYRFHSYPEYAVSYLTEKENISLKSAVRILDRLSIHKDILDEFCGCVRSGEYIPCADPVSAGGYTAEKLVNQPMTKVTGLRVP
jgi:hypothetical protein